MRASFHYLVFLLIGPMVFFGQKRTFNPGDKVNISVDLYDESGRSQAVPVPGEAYTLIFNYKWKGDAKDTKDSIKKLSKIVSKIVKKYKLPELRVICYSLDKGSAYKDWMGSLEEKKPLEAVPNCKAEYYNTNDYSSVSKQLTKLFERINLVAPDGRMLAKSNSLSEFEKDTALEIKSTSLLRARLMVDSAGLKFPLIHALVSLLGGTKADTLATATTDDHGDFEIPIPDDEESTYEIKIRSDARMKDVSIVERDGTEIAKMNKTENGFTYRLLKADITRLAEIPETHDDITAAYKRFMTGNRKVLRVVEYVQYDLGKFTLQKDASAVLDQIAAILKENPAAKLEVISHTDSQGDDVSNLSLSEKRSHAVVNYLVSKGIQKNRLKAIGKGETVIRNRCLNGINCSDNEHAFNRRTEFNFTK
jgi:outer membrane protein OmpA-like peptidoglycan-associated protein